MLAQLYIKNYAIIDEVNLSFEPGFNVITGETGAGKSILLGALGLILGKRAASKVLYDQNTKCIVQATFQLDDNQLAKVPSSDDYDLDHTLVLRRDINAKGKSRAFINDTPVLLSQLREVASTLVDIHNQFDTLSITEPAYQLEVIDMLSQSDDEKAIYQQTYHAFQEAQKELQKLKKEQARGREDLDYARFQLEELEKIELDTLDQKEVEEELQMLQNSEAVQLALGKLSAFIIEGDMSVENQMLDILREMNQVASVNTALQAITDRLNQTLEEMRDIDHEAQQILDSIEHDPARIQQLQDTLDHIYHLQKKHNCNSLEELIELRDQLSQKINNTVNLAELIADAQEAMEKAQTAMQEKADILSQKRKAIKPQLEKQLAECLQLLAISNADIDLHFEKLPHCEISGCDEVDIRFSSNKGIAPQSIAGTASGGELSRIALSVKQLLAGNIAIPTMIFDEIDTGISGAVALQLGKILLEISEKHQVICITHSPQVASGDGRHFYVHKEDTAERTITQVIPLEAEARIDEIAKMLSTDPPSAAALANARELLKLN